MIRNVGSRLGNRFLVEGFMKHIFMQILVLMAVSTTLSAQVIEWKKAVGGPSWPPCELGLQIYTDKPIAKTPDGGLALACFAESGNGNYDINLIRMDSSGNTLWREVYGSSGYDAVSGLGVCADGGLILGGTSSLYGSPFIMKTDSLGDYEWSKW